MDQTKSKTMLRLQAQPAVVWFFACFSAVLLLGPDQSLGQNPLSGAGTGGNQFEIDRQAFDALARLRRELVITNIDLAAMGCDQDSSEEVLQALVQWYTTNQTGIAGLDAEIHQKRMTMKRLRSKISKGPRNERLINETNELQAQINSLMSGRDQYLKDAVVEILEPLSEDKKGIHRILTSNRGCPGALRFVPDLTRDQVQSYRRYVRASLADYGLNELSVSQQETVAQIRGNIKTYQSAVAAAQDNVLPEPKIAQQAS